MIDVTLRDRFYIVSLPKSILVLTKAELIQALRQGQWWPQTTTMDVRRR
jgi:hypothetical protein